MQAKLRGQPAERFAILAAFLGALIVVSGFATGCDETEGTTADAVLVPQTSVFGSAPELLGPPTLDELVARLDLTDEQAAEIGPALEELQARFEARRERREEHRGRRGSGQGPGFGGPAEGRRGAGEGRRGGPGFGEGPGCGAGFGPGDSFHSQFLEVCASVLDTDQFVELTEFLQERRQQHVQQVENGRGPRGRGMGMMLGGLLREADLSAEQREAVRDALPEIGERMRDLWRAFAQDEISAEALRDGLAGVRRDIESTLRSILDAEQFEALEGAVAERRAEFAERRLEHVGDGIDRRVERLTRILRLSDDQGGQVRAALEGFVPRQREILEGVGSGSLESEDAIYQGLVLRAEIHDSIRGLLTADQAERFDALRDHGGPGRGRIPFFI